MWTICLGLFFIQCLEVTCFLLTGIARGHRDPRQASGKWLQEDVQECECKAETPLFQI
uniref:Uncharacterized protein n=1 Tax=Sus scrofa TaxID=9823 RepID=A0A8D1RVK3_PIG